MFDYARITAVHEYLKERFPNAFVSSFTGSISRFGDAHNFELDEQGTRLCLTVSHRFLAECAGSIEAYFDQQGIASMLRRSNRLRVSARGLIEEVNGQPPLSSAARSFRRVWEGA